MEMLSTMMHLPMTVRMLMEHGTAIFPTSKVGEFDGKTMTYLSYQQVADRAVKLAAALREIGVRPGDRVGTYCWNNRAHLETYLAVPSMGAVMHTLNIRLSTEQVAWVINHAEDTVLLLDHSLIEQFLPAVPLLRTVRHIVVTGGTDTMTLESLPVSQYDELLSAQGADYDWPDIDETQAAAVCYTSGTTGNPKGVVYSHRTTFLHSMASRATDTFGINERDRILLLPPMFHANAWGLPYSGWMSGSDFIMPGSHLQPGPVRTMIRMERPTFTAMVPTVLGDLLRSTGAEAVDMSSFRMLVCGGSAVAPSMIDAARERWGIPVLQGWGMTETSPLCALSHPPRNPGVEGETPWRAKSGRPVPGVQVRVVDMEGQPLPWDGATVGELQLRGLWITGGYHNLGDADSLSQDGWLRTGDVGHIDARGYVQVTDRTKDVIKSGGEWISSVDLENTLLAHPRIVEVAVIAIHDERWQERPLAILTGGADVPSPSELRDFLAGQVAKFWIPEYWSELAEIPKTSVGKINKKQLRDLYESGRLEVRQVK